LVSLICTTAAVDRTYRPVLWTLWTTHSTYHFAVRMQVLRLLLPPHPAYRLQVATVPWIRCAALRHATPGGSTAVGLPAPPPTAAAWTVYLFVTRRLLLVPYSTATTVHSPHYARPWTFIFPATGRLVTDVIFRDRFFLVLLPAPDYFTARNWLSPPPRTTTTCRHLRRHAMPSALPLAQLHAWTAPLPAPYFHRGTRPDGFCLAVTYLQLKAPRTLGRVTTYQLAGYIPLFGCAHTTPLTDA